MCLCADPCRFSGVVGRRYSVSAYLRYLPFEPAHTVCSTTNGNAKTSGADATVNGYLIFILYSVVFLASASYLPSPKVVFHY